MSGNLVYSLEQLETADLLIDARYAGGRNGNASDDPLTRLLSLSNGGGFRTRGKYEDPRLIALSSSMEDPDWPDDLDLTTGVLTYYGDNKQPGRKLNETPRRGNFLLEQMFSQLHAGERHRIPPVLIFTKPAIIAMWCSAGWLCRAQSGARTTMTWWRCGTPRMGIVSRIIERRLRCWICQAFPAPGCTTLSMKGL